MLKRLQSGEAVRALGTMSGTSLDGVDAAELVTDGHRIEAFGKTAYRTYTPVERETIRAALGQWQDGPDVPAAAEVVETVHAQVLSTFDAPDLIGFHGQTLAHDPHGRGTHQAGDGNVLAQVLGIPVIWDFRSADVRMGGQGAPLAPFFHFACGRWIGAKAPLAFLNLGGVGNLTWFNPREPAPDVAGACLAFDTGPANAPINDLIQARLGQAQDFGGALAAKGTPDASVIAAFLNYPYFFRIPPKSLDRNDFNSLLDAVAGLSDADAAATLTLAAARAVLRGAEHFPQMPTQILVTGGGRHNATMMAMLSDEVPCDVLAVEAVGLDGDMLEAQAFAYLAVRVARGLSTSCPGTTGVPAAVGGGQISRPDPSTGRLSAG